MFSSKCCCKYLLLIIIFLQLVSTIERQVFDFLGHMWTPILVNFLTILFIILGCFGVQQRRKLYLILYAFSQILTLFWNAFIIFFYLEIGSHFSRDQDLHLLNLGTGAKSWWVFNAPKCSAHNLTSSAIPAKGGIQPSSKTIFIKPVLMQQCILDYYYIESLQSALQIILSLFAIILTITLMFKFYKHSYDDVNGNMESGHLPPYSITLSPRTIPIRRSLPHQQRNKRTRLSTRSSHSHRTSVRRKKQPRPHQYPQFNPLDMNNYYGGNYREPPTSSHPGGQRFTPQSMRRQQQQLDTSSLDSFAPPNYGGGPHINPAFFGGSAHSVYTLNSRPLRHSPIYMNSETRI